MTPEPKFLRRFEQIRTALRRYQGRLGLAATLLTAAAGLGLLAWADYRLELPRATRAAGLAAASAIALLVLWRWLVAPLRWWTQPRTATEIEGRFPQLGQRIRTVVQFAGKGDERITREGVKPSLVEALEEETEERATPLPLDQVVRWPRAHALSALAAVPVALLVVAAATGPEWRTAIGRALLIERPYTTVEVKPGDVMVDQGVDVPIVVELKGRPRQSVVLQTRPLGKPDAGWKSEKLADPSAGTSRRETKVEKVKDSIEYRVVAGPAEGPRLRYAIRVRYPLAIKALEVRVTPPGYTMLDPKTSKGGDVQAVEGSVAAFKVAFDATPVEASLEMVDPSPRPPKKGEPAPGPITLPLRPEGGALVATLPLVKDLDYQIVARTADGRVLPKKKYRIDVREDHAPRVVFDEPDEVLEVHPIAEVRHRIRVDDDFGLTRSGIVYRFNDGEEKTLIARDFPLARGQKPKTSATLEEMLLMETLGATPQDSLTYYAFAEDNLPPPVGPRRTETDLRYIDFRSFKREYKLAEPGSGDGDPQELIALNELIARQRVNLNRANRLARHKPTDRTQAEDPLKIAGFEEALLNLSKEFTEGIEALADARVDSLHKALDAMQAALDALDRSRNEEAPLAMAEALKHLIAARRDLEFLILDNPALAAALRKFDRSQAQKIRKPKNKDQEAEEIADRLEELAQEEDFVYATLVADAQPSPMPAPGAQGPQGQKAEPKEAEKGEPKEAEKEAQARAEAEKGQDGPKGQGEKGQDGPKGQGEKGQGEKGQDGPKGQAGKGEPRGQGQAEEGEGGAGEPKKLDRRGVSEKQEQIADEVRDLEEKLKRLEAVSDLAKARMGKAAERVEKASGNLTRGNTKEATEDAKLGAGMLHELARQVKGEIAREVADELAMARDLAEELARREADLADRNEGPSPSGSPGDREGKDGQGKEAPKKDGKGGMAKEAQAKQGKDGQGKEKDGQGKGEEAKNGKEGQGKGAEAKDGKDGQGQGEKEGKDGQGEGEKGRDGQGKEGQGPGEKGMEGKDGKGEGDQGQGDGEKGRGRGTKPGQGGRGAAGGWADLTEAEQIDRMAEMARTLEEWLKQIDKKGEGKAAEAVGEILDKGNVAEIVERAGRMGEVRLAGTPEELGREARELANRLAVLGEALELLHRGIVAPQLAAMVEFDRRVAELTAKLGDLKTEAAVAAWRGEVAALIRDLEKAGIEGTAELADALRVAGGWHWDDAHRHLVAPDEVITTLQVVTVQIKDRVQDLILKDLASARDEATPPKFRELVERYYEVLSQGARAK